MGHIPNRIDASMDSIERKLAEIERKRLQPTSEVGNDATDGTTLKNEYVTGDQIYAVRHPLSDELILTIQL